MRSADECVAPGRRQPRETRRTSDGRLSSPETNLKVGLLPLFFMQLLLSHMFLLFMVRTSPLTKFGEKKFRKSLVNFLAIGIMNKCAKFGEDVLKRYRLNSAAWVSFSDIFESPR